MAGLDEFGNRVDASINRITEFVQEVVVSSQGLCD